MEREKSFLRDKGLGYFLALPTVILAVASILLYRKNGITEFSPNLNQRAIYAAWAAAALSAASLALDHKIIKYAAYLAALYACMEFLSSQVTYIANVFVSIDGTSFSSGMLQTFGCFLAAAVVGLVAAITDHWKPFGDKKGGEA